MTWNHLVGDVTRNELKFSLVLMRGAEILPTEISDPQNSTLLPEF